MCSGLETCSQYLQRHNEYILLISWCVQVLKHVANIYKDTMIHWTTDKLMSSGLETYSQYLQRHNDTLDYW